MWLRPEADHSPPPSADVKSVELYHQSHLLLHGMHRDNVTLMYMHVKVLLYYRTLETCTNTRNILYLVWPVGQLLIKIC